MVICGVYVLALTMDDVDVEKNELLASIRLQEEALSLSVADTSKFITCDSDSDDGDSVIQVDVSNIKVPVDDDVGDAEQEQEVDIQPTWTDVLCANVEYDEALARVEQDIRQNIDRVEKELTIVRKKISRISDVMSATSSKNNRIYIFGMPYFKDSNYYPCPKNEDYCIKRQNREICWSELPTFHQWVPNHKKKLVGAIKKLSLQRCETKARVKFTVLRKELEAAKICQDHEKVAILEEKVATFNLGEEANNMLQETIENDEHDWMQISAKYLHGRQSPEGCRSFWHMYMHPKINKGPWTSDEENRLKKIAQKHNLENWDEITSELGTKRSGYQCFIVYQTKLNDALKRNVWSAEEDRQLLAVVERCRIGDYVPWGKVAFNMDGRTKTQVFNRWTYSLNPSIKKGRFTSAEDIMILVGVNMWGENFQRIANFMKDRTTCQVRDRFQNYLSREDLAIPWHTEDDERLLALGKTYGKNWAKIAKHFPSKDRTQVRHRFNTLSKWREANPDSPLKDAPMRRYCPRTSKNFTVQWDRARAILGCETIDEMVVAKDNLVTTLKGKKGKLKKKRTSIVETDMINYFRCCYDLPGGRRRYQLRTGEADRYSDELLSLIKILKVRLTLPSNEELLSDRSLSQADKDILVALKLKLESATIKDSPPDSPDHPSGIYSQENPHPAGNLSPLLEQSTPSTSFTHNGSSSTSNIDYISSHATSSVYIDLPLLNFQKDEIVVDEKPFVDFSHVASDENRDYLFVGVCDDVKSEELYLCPPNFTTLVGLRTYLLNRRTLIDWRNGDQSTVRKFSDVQNEKVKGALDLFNKRMLSLFVWPALMSRTAPCNTEIFFEAEEKTPRCNPGIFPPPKRKASGEIRPSELVLVNEPNPSMSAPSTSGCTRKRRRLCPLSGKFVWEFEQSNWNENYDEHSSGQNCNDTENSGDELVCDTEQENSPVPESSSNLKPYETIEVEIVNDSSINIKIVEVISSP